MLKSTCVLSALLIAAITQTAFAQGSQTSSKAELKRARIDAMAERTLARVFAQQPSSKELYANSYGHAVFSNIKIALGVSGGAGNGVAITKGTKARSYMKMGTAGIGIGLGGQKYQVVFLFQTKSAYDNFVLNGWQADTSANAVAGTAGKSAESTFTKGLAIYLLSDNGLMLHADVAGTKYWRNKRLNTRL